MSAIFCCAQRWRAVLILLLVCVGAAMAKPQEPLGNPPLQFFGPRDYAAGPLNWSVLQDQRGLIYAANADGVLEFDGVSWRLIRTDRKTRARSLAMASDGRVYVGAQGEFGYLAADPMGQMRYVALSDQVPQAERDFSDVWLIHNLASGVYFRSQRRLFRLYEGRLRSWPLKDVNYSASIGNRLLLFDSIDGVLELVGESLQVLAGTDPKLLGDVQLILPWNQDGQVRVPADGILLGSKQKGLHIWRAGKVQALNSPVNALLARDGLRGARLLANSAVVILTLAEGPMLLDDKLRLLQRLGRAQGVAGDRAFEVALDRQGDLWLALDTGVARVAAFDALSRFEESTLGGSVLTALRLGDRLYVGSNTRLTWLGSLPGDAERTGINGHVRHLLDFDGRLMTAGNGGVYELFNGQTRLLRANVASELRRSRRDPQRVWVAERDGLASLYFQDGKWVDEGKRLDTTSVVRSMAEDREGGLWVGTDLEGVLHIAHSAQLPSGPLTADRVQHFNIEQGLPSLEDNQVFELEYEVLVRSREGIFRLNAAGDHFAPDARFSRLFAERAGWQLSPLGGLTVDDRGWLWLQAREQLSNDTELGALVPQGDGSYLWEAKDLLSLRGTNVTSIYAEGDALLWFGTNEGLYRYDRRIRRKNRHTFSTLIRRISHSDGRLLFGGAGDPSASAPVPLVYADNNLFFDFAAPSYVEPRATRYQIWLEGFDAKWSPWSGANHKEYTNLAPGGYRFRVRARNIYDQLGSEAAYTFQVLAPWYLSWPAYVSYVLGVFGFGWLTLRWRVRKLERDKEVLAQYVAERTEDLQQSSEQLRLARDHAERERQAAEQATRSKSEFLASMSHEIRTPMNAIIGFAHLGQQLSRQDRSHDYFGKIAGAGQSLLAIVNDILDFSKIEAGGMDLEVTGFDVAELLARVEELFAHQAHAKGIELALAIGTEVPQRLLGDPLRLGQVLTNLVSNALKFTEHGQVLTQVRVSEREAARVQLRFSVKDSGIGIAAEHLQSLFQAFAQAEAGTARHYGGTGLGLAISQRLVRMMGGDILVDSAPGRGSEFAFSAWFGLDAATTPTRSLREGFGGKLGPGGSSGPIAPGSIKYNVQYPDLAGAHVLVVEDNLINQQVAAEILKLVGIQTTMADSGEQALRMLAEQRFDAVLMDVHMPGMDGLEATRQLRAVTALRQLPVIAMTADALKGYREQCLAAGMNDALSKPVEPERLFQVLSYWLGGAQPIDARGASINSALSAPKLLDSERAIVRLGGQRDFYSRLLPEFKRDCDGLPAKLDAALAARDHALARRILHNFKGVAGNLGANAAEAAAARLEYTLFDATPGDLASALQAFNAALTATLAAIHALDTPEKTEPEVAMPRQQRAASEVALELMLRLQRHDPRAEALFAELKSALTNVAAAGELEAAQAYLDAYDFKAARASLQPLLDRLRLSK